MYNRAILIGRICQDLELKTTPSGISVTSFSIAVDRPMAKEKTTDFISVQAWRQNAEFISKYFSKGKLIGIEGSIQTRNYDDKNGNKRTAVEVVADRAFFTESKGDGSYKTANSRDAEVGGFEVVGDDSDLPF